MGFMVPMAEHFERADLVEIGKPFRCSHCDRMRTKYNVTAGGEGVFTCISPDCAPPIPGWYSHLSAPGYMDQTDWHGPYSSADEALKAVMDFYEVDENGDSLDDEAENTEESDETVEV